MESFHTQYVDVADETLCRQASCGDQWAEADLVVRYHRRRLCLPIHDVADRQGGAGLDLFQAHGRGADEQQVVDERLPDLARPLPVCPPGEVHRDIALHADAVQIALYEHLAAVGDAQCVPALFVFRIFSHGHTLGTPPHGCGCQAMK